MNNNELRFDPNTGQPLNNSVNNNEINQPEQNLQQPTQNINNNQENIDSNANIQQQMQSIPTVDQNQQVFLNNSQTGVSEKKENKKDSGNIAFLVIIFIIIFAAILFLFPYLTKLAM